MSICDGWVHWPTCVKKSVCSFCVWILISQWLHKPVLLQAVGAYLWSQTSIQTLVALHQGVAFFLYLEADSFWHCYYRLVLQCCFLYYGTRILGHCCLALLLRCCFLYLTDSFRHRCHHLLLQGPHHGVVFSIMCLSDSFRFWFHHLLLHILFKHVEELQFCLFVLS